MENITIQSDNSTGFKFDDFVFYLEHDSLLFVVIFQMPYLYYSIALFYRYQKFNNIGTFNVKWAYPWYTRAKISLSILLTLMSSYRIYLLVNSDNTIFSLEVYFMLWQLLSWLTYPCLLIFDLKRALHHDWSLIKPFHI
jgi:hypothetical protein